MEETLMTAREVAARLNVHPNTIYELCARRILPSIKIGGARRFERSEIEDFLANGGREYAEPEVAK